MMNSNTIQVMQFHQVGSFNNYWYVVKCDEVGFSKYVYTYLHPDLEFHPETKDENTLHDDVTTYPGFYATEELAKAALLKYKLKGTPYVDVKINT